MIKLHKDFSESLKLKWITLSQNSNLTVFQSYTWNLNWYNNIGKNNNVELFIFEFIKKGQTIAIFPFCLSKKLNFKILSLLGGLEADYQIPIYDSEKIKLNKINEINLFENFGEWDAIHLRNIPERFLWVINLINLQNKKYKNFLFNSYSIKLPIEDNKELEHLSSNLKRDTKRRLRKLNDRGKVTFEVINNFNFKQKTDSKKYYEFIYQYTALTKQNGWKNIFEKKNVENFYKSFLIENNSEINFNLSFLKVDNQIIASHWGLVFKDTFYWILPSYSKKWSFYSPGRLLLYKLILWSSNKKISEFDLTIGDEKYKSQWFNKKQKIYEILYYNSFKGFLYICYCIQKKYLQRFSFLKTVIVYFRKNFY